MKAKKVLPILWLAIYLLFIIYTTLYNRDFSLEQTVRLDLFCSYNEWFGGNAGSGRQILLNIAMFVPLGVFLSHVLQCWNVKRPRLWAILFSLGVTITIEDIQYVDGLGFCDLDDVFNNVLGAWIGTYIFHICKELDDKTQRTWYTNFATVLCLIAGIVGCQMVGPVQQKPLLKKIMEYDFAVKNIVSDGKNLILAGYCRAYSRDVIPRYQIVLKGEKTGRLYKSDTAVDGHVFRAVVPAVPDEKVEVDIKFKYYSPVSTFSYINEGRVEDVSGTVPEPDVEGTDLVMIANYGVLKAYDASNDTYVYQINNRLYWLIGSTVDKQTAVFCHLYTNEVDRLPEKRKKYRFDNLDFRVGAKNELTQFMRCGRYRVFYREIPSSFNVTAVCTGFYANKKRLWQKYFRVMK